jgi:hypothetical protein
LLLLAATGCGGGGGGGGGGTQTFALTFDAAGLTARLFHDQHHLQNTYTSSVRASVAGRISPVPTGNLYVKVVEDQPVFLNDAGVTVLSAGASSADFTFSVTPDVGLAPGLYTGHLTVQVFEDAAMTKAYGITGGTIPYSVRVDPELTVSITIDGELLTTTCSSSSTAVTSINGSTIYWNPPGSPTAAVTVKPGQIIELHASRPVTWRSPDQFYPYGSLWDAPTITSTSLTQTVAAPPSGSPGMVGNPYIATLPGNSQWGAGLVIDIRL